MSTPLTDPAADPLNRSRRVDVVDALRGFALAGILLLHNVEKYNFMWSPDMQIDLFPSLDGHVWTALFAVFGGKAYAIFSMLFGFSFWVQYERMQAKGYDMGGRFVWRLCLLFSFGLLHSSYYSGDLLIFYSSFGLLLVAMRKAPDWLAFAVSIVLLTVPFHLYELLRLLADPDFAPIPKKLSWPYWGLLGEAQAYASFPELSRAFLTNGLKANVLWTWDAGRMFHIPGLFLLGMLAARRKLFTDMASKRWAILGSVALVAYIPLNYAKSNVWGWCEGSAKLGDAFYAVLSPYEDLAMLLFMVSAFILLWRAGLGRRLFGWLIPYGRMSLTNYMTQGLTGVILYNGCGLGLWHYFGHTLSMITGVFILVLQVLFSRWCLKNFGQGPMEKLWRRLMWIGHKSAAAKSA